MAFKTIKYCPAQNKNVLLIIYKDTIKNFNFINIE